MTIVEVVREEAARFGCAMTDAEVEHVLWEHTGWPAFWNIPADGNTPEECLRKQVRGWAVDPAAAELRLAAELACRETPEAKS